MILGFLSPGRGYGRPGVGGMAPPSYLPPAPGHTANGSDGPLPPLGIAPTILRRVVCNRPVSLCHLRSILSARRFDSALTLSTVAAAAVVVAALVVHGGLVARDGRERQAATGAQAGLAATPLAGNLPEGPAPLPPAA